MGVHGLARSAESPLSLFLSPAPREAAEQASPHLGCLCRGPGSRGPRARAWLGSCTVRSRRGGGRGNAAPSVSRAPGLSASQAAPWVVWLPSPPPPWPETPDRGPVPRPPVRFAPRQTWQEEAASPAPPASPPARIPRDAGARGPPSAAGRMASGLARGPCPVRVPPETCCAALPPPGPRRPPGLLRPLVLALTEPPGPPRDVSMESPEEHPAPFQGSPGHTEGETGLEPEPVHTCSRRPWSRSAKGGSRRACVTDGPVSRWGPSARGTITRPRRGARCRRSRRVTDLGVAALGDTRTHRPPAVTPVHVSASAGRKWASGRRGPRAGGGVTDGAGGSPSGVTRTFWKQASVMVGWSDNNVSVLSATTLFTGRWSNW